MTMPSRVRAIVAEIAIRHGVTADQILGTSRKRKIAYARWECWATLRAAPGPSGHVPSLPQIGAWFGRHHTTIQDGVTRREELSQSEAA